MTAYQSVMARKNEIMKKAVGIDYDGLSSKVAPSTMKG